jgi:hypothetical protein
MKFSEFYEMSGDVAVKAASVCETFYQEEYR